MTEPIQLAVDEANDSIGARGARLQASVLDDSHRQFMSDHPPKPARGPYR
jgi:hypothetical protein